MAAVLKAFNVEINNKALRSKNLPTKLKVLSWGKNETNDGDVYLTDESLRVFDAYQKRAGRDKALAIDFDHCTVKGSKEYVAGQPKFIAGYGDPVIVKDDGLYLYNVEWTPDGEKYARNYKDLSPAAVIDKTGVVLGLDSVALTPHGAVRDLNFFSAGGFDVNMLKEMSVKPGKNGFVLDSDEGEYNTGGANPAVKVTGGKAQVKAMAEPNTMFNIKDDEEALAKTKELEKHEEAEIEAQKTGKEYEKLEYSADADSDVEDDKEDESEEGEDEYSGMDDKMMEHRDKVLEMAAEDHYSKYGDVEYADAKNHRYPINNEKHVRAAWSYINMPKNASKVENLSKVKGRIKSAAKKFGVNISEDKEKTKTMSAENPSFPDAYKAQPLQYNTMNDTIIKKMAAEVGMDGESDQEKVLFAFLAKYEGLKAEVEGQITKKDNTEGGGVGKTFSADIDFLKKEIELLKNTKVEDTNKHDQTEREQLVRQAAREGKLVPLSADQVKTVNIDILRSIISNQPRNVVPLGSALRVLSVQGDDKPSREKAVQAFEQMIVK